MSRGEERVIMALEVIDDEYLIAPIKCYRERERESIRSVVVHGGESG